MTLLESGEQRYIKAINNCTFGRTTGIFSVLPLQCDTNSTDQLLVLLGRWRGGDGGGGGGGGIVVDEVK